MAQQEGLSFPEQGGPIGNFAELQSSARPELTGVIGVAAGALAVLAALPNILRYGPAMSTSQEPPDPKPPTGGRW